MIRLLLISFFISSSAYSEPPSGKPLPHVIPVEKPHAERPAIECWKNLRPWVVEDPYRTRGSSRDLSPIRSFVIGENTKYIWFDKTQSKIFIFDQNTHQSVDYKKNKKYILPGIPDPTDVPSFWPETIKEKFEKQRSQLKTNTFRFCYGADAIIFVFGMPTYDTTTKKFQMDYSQWNIRAPIVGDCSIPEKTTVVATGVVEKDGFDEDLVKDLFKTLQEKTAKVSKAGLNYTADENTYLGKALAEAGEDHSALFAKASAILNACEPLLKAATDLGIVKKAEVAELRETFEFIIRGWRPKVVEKP